jgi:hypothetical protein
MRDPNEQRARRPGRIEPAVADAYNLHAGIVQQSAEKTRSSTEFEARAFAQLRRLPPHLP